MYISKWSTKCVNAQECEDAPPNSEYACVNNYKPLDENYKFVFVSGAFKKVLKFQKEYCYQGDSLYGESITPKNKGENYSIQCKFEDPICKRAEKLV